MTVLLLSQCASDERGAEERQADQPQRLHVVLCVCVCLAQCDRLARAYLNRTCPASRRQPRRLGLEACFLGCRRMDRSCRREGLSPRQTTFAYNKVYEYASSASTFTYLGIV